MKIETKYNIGDEVWTLDVFDEPCRATIEAINTYRTRLGGHDRVTYYIHNIGNIDEKEVFPTKEELLKSL